MSQLETYRIGPAWIFVADNVTDPLDQWTKLGYTQGNVTATVVDGKLLLSRVDQLGTLPPASFVYKQGDTIELNMPLLDKQIDNLIKVVPSAVKLTNNAKDAFAMTSGVEKITGQAFSVVPIEEFTEDDPWWDADFALWMFNGIANVDNQIDTFKRVEADDRHPYSVTVSHVDDSLGRAGIGPIWIPDHNIDVLGFDVAAEMGHRITDSDLETALNNAGFNTMRDLVGNTGSIDLSAGTLTTLPGLDYAFQSSGIDVSGNSVSESAMSDFIDRLWTRRASLGEANCVINISSNNGVDADATAKIDGTGNYLYAIQAVDQTNKTFTVEGDQRGKFRGGRKFSVEGSTGNDGTYTVNGDLRVEYDPSAEQTTIPVNEAISDSTADGSVNDGLVGAGCTVTT